MSKDKDKSSKPKGIFYWLAMSLFVALPFIWFMENYFPNVIPFRFDEFWYVDIRTINGIFASWPIFLWGGGLTLLGGMLGGTKGSADLYGLEGKGFKHAFISSVLAGVLEEIIWRWLLFFATIALVKIINYILLGFLSDSFDHQTTGLFYWLFMWIYAPIANFFTAFHIGWLLYGMGWAVGSATLSSSASFRKEHQYLGLFGVFNSWILSFFFFWLMFRYGLPAAIASHFLYDFLIFSIVIIFKDRR